MDNGIGKDTDMNIDKNRIKKIKILRSVLGKYCLSSFFASLWTEPQARSINLRKKNESKIFPVRTEQVSSIKFSLLSLYFEFLDGIAHFIGDKVRATIRRENFFLLRHFRQNFLRFLLNVKMFSFEYLVKNTNQ